MSIFGIPRGNISVVEAFHRLRRSRGDPDKSEPADPSERRAWIKRWDKAATDLLQALIDGELVSYVLEHDNPIKPPVFRISSANWRAVKDLDSVFDSNENRANAKPFLNPSLRKCTFQTLPYLNEREFDDWCQQPKTKPSTSELKSWFKCRLRDWPKHRKPPTEADDLAVFRKKFPGVKRDVFRELRRANLPTSWVTQGKRKLPPENSK